MSLTASCMSLPLRSDENVGAKPVSVRSSARASVELNQSSRIAHVPSKDRKNAAKSSRPPARSPVTAATSQLSMPKRIKSDALANDNDVTRNISRVSCLSSRQQSPLMCHEPFDSTGQSSETQSLRRKPSLIANFVSDQRRVAVDDYSREGCSPNTGSHGSDDSFVISQQDHASNVHVKCADMPSTCTSQHLTASDENLIGASFYHPARSPAFYSQISATPSIRQNRSPASIFTHATALTSRTSYSPLYAASPSSTLLSHSSPVPAKVRRNGKTASKKSTATNVTFRDKTNQQIPIPQEVSGKLDDPIVRTEMRLSPALQDPIEARSFSEQHAKPRNNLPLHGVSLITTTPPELAHLLDQSPEVSPKAMISNHSARRHKVSAHQNTEPAFAVSCSISNRIDSFASTTQDIKVTDHKSINTGQINAESRSSLALSQTGQPSTCMPVFVKARATSPTAAPQPPIAELVSSQRKTNSSRPSFGFGWRREKGNLADPKEPTKGFARTKLDALRHYTGKGSTSKSTHASTLSNSLPLGTNMKNQERSVNSHVPLDEFLSSRLEPVYLRGAAQSLGSQECKVEDDHVPDPVTEPLIGSQHLPMRSHQGEENLRHYQTTAITNPTAVVKSSTSNLETRDSQNEEHISNPTPLSSAKLQQNNDGPQQLDPSVSIKHAHWSLFPRGSQEKPVQKKGFLRRALSMASKKSPGTLPNTTSKLGLEPPSIMGQNIVNVPCSPVSRTSIGAKRLSENDHILKESPSKKILTEAQFMRDTDRNTRRVMDRKNESQATYDTLKQHIDRFSHGTVKYDFSPNVSRDARSDRQKKRPLSGALKPLSMNPHSPQLDQHISRGIVSLATPQTASSDNLSPQECTGQPSEDEVPDALGTDTTVYHTGKPAINLERVLEDELLSFSQSRNSTCSNASSSGTLYFPVAPTHPPLGSLPKLPDYARSLDIHVPVREQRNEFAPNVSKEIIAKVSSSPPTSFVPIKSTNFKNSKTEKVGKVHGVEKEAPSLTNLRFASLMTSKWLSFGRVLLSNVTTNDRILVIDGLGKDWSYYCALTYPSAKVYTLSAGSCRSRPSSISGLQPPSNHQDVPYPNVNARFPFVDNFFTATVFRFPLATTDAALHHAISECTRVLRPGGYMEISAVDLDLANMGSRGRRSVRELKTRTHSSRPEISLKPVSDNIQLLLGQCGFKKLSRCVIGVPAAGTVAEPKNSSDEKSCSFRELMNDESAHNDQGIAKMVSKVGRWWYAQCYEHGNLSRSIWSNELLLRECEQLHTAFKLFICYTQKPNGEESSAASSFEA